MPVDYADKKPKPKKKGAKRSPSKGRGASARRSKQSQSKPPLRLLGLAAVLIGIFVLALVWLKGDSAEDGPQSPILFTEQNDNGVAQATLDALPEAPQERWQYFEALENHSVEVVVPDRAESRRRLMQCGSFRRESDAQELRARIAMAGYESQVRRTESAEHGVWFRVVLGPFEGLRPAQTVNNQLRRNNVHGCQIWYWNLD